MYGRLYAILRSITKIEERPNNEHKFLIEMSDDHYQVLYDLKHFKCMLSAADIHEEKQNAN